MQTNDQILPVPAEPIQPGCNPNSIFASTQCRGAWQQYKTAVQSRNDIIQHNAFGRARMAGAEEAQRAANEALEQQKQAANQALEQEQQAADQALKEHDSEIASLRSEIAVITAHQRPIFIKGIGLGAATVLALFVILYSARRFFFRFTLVRREAGRTASA